MTTNKLLLIPLVAGLALSLAACGGQETKSEPAQPEGEGRLTFRMIDAPGDAEHLWVSVQQISLRPCQGGGWLDVPTIPAPFDLLELASENAFQTISKITQLPLGHYCETRLVLGEEAMVELEGGESQVLEVPSGSSSGYKIKGEYEVRDDALTVVTLDFDAEQSLHKAGNSGKYMLKPVVFIDSAEYLPLDTPLPDIRIDFPSPRSLAEIANSLPENVQIRGLIVEFETGVSGTLALSSPTQDPNEIIAQHVEAQGNLFNDLRDLLSIETPGLVGPDAEQYQEHRFQEIENLNNIEDLEPTLESLQVSRIHVDGPIEQVEQLAIALDGSVK